MELLAAFETTLNLQVQLLFYEKDFEISGTVLMIIINPSIF